MSSYTYKNLLIIERGSTNTFTSNVKTVPELWFPTNIKPFTYQSIQDKIILVYDTPFDRTDNIKDVDRSTQLNNKILGVFKILCDGVNIRCFSCVGTHIVKNLPLFREYLLKTIKMCTSVPAEIDRLKFSISWDLPNEMNSLYADIVRVGLMSDVCNKSHYFSSKVDFTHVIPTGFAPTPVTFVQNNPTPITPVTFGQNTSGFSFGKKW